MRGIISLFLFFGFLYGEQKVVDFSISEPYCDSSRSTIGLSVSPFGLDKFLITGNFFSLCDSPNLENKIFISKFDSNLTCLWTRVYKFNDEVSSGCIIQDSGGFIIGGSFSFNPLFLKIDTLGNIIWSRRINVGERVYSVVKTSKGEYLFTGKGFLVSKFSASGEHIYTKGFNMYFYRGNSIDVTYDNGVIITGEIYGLSNGGNDLFVSKLDSSGNIEWLKIFSGSDRDAGLYVKSLEDKGFMVAGITRSINPGGLDIIFIRIDSLGNLLWSKVIGSSGDDSLYSLFYTPDKNFLIYGRSYFNGSSPENFYMELDSLLNPLKTKVISSYFEVLSDYQTIYGISSCLIFINHILWLNCKQGGISTLIIKSDKNLGICLDNYTNSLPVSSVNLNIIAVDTPLIDLSTSVDTPYWQEYQVVDYTSIWCYAEVKEGMRKNNLYYPLVYPRVFTNRINILLPEKGKLRIRIYDITGRKLLDNTCISSFVTLEGDEISSLPRGIYILEISSSQGVQRLKIIKSGISR